MQKSCCASTFHRKQRSKLLLPEGKTTESIEKIAPLCSIEEVGRLLQGWRACGGCGGCSDCVEFEETGYSSAI